MIAEDLSPGDVFEHHDRVIELVEITSWSNNLMVVVVKQIRCLVGYPYPPFEKIVLKRSERVKLVKK